MRPKDKGLAVAACLSRAKQDRCFLERCLPPRHRCLVVVNAELLLSDLFLFVIRSKIVEIHLLFQWLAALIEAYSL